MRFDRNINGNRDVKFLECDYLLLQRCMKLTLVASSLLHNIDYYSNFSTKKTAVNTKNESQP